MINREPLNDKFTWMHSGQTGAPQVTAQRGSEGEFLQMLDATLINGFNEQIATSVSIDGSRVSLNFGLAPGFIPRQRVTISGSDDPLLNGNHAVVEITPQAIVLNISGVTITTGIVKAKVAPLGFESIFGSADPLKRAYRSKDLTSTRTVLYLDMSLRTGHGYSSSSPVQRAMVTLCGDMTSLGVPINSHTDTINNYAKNANGTLMWHVGRNEEKRSVVNDPSNRSWVVVGNGKIFYLFMRWQTYEPSDELARDFYAFGDTEPLGSIDSYGCIWAGAITPNDNDSASPIYNFIYNGSRIASEVSPSSAVGVFIKSYDGVSNADRFAVGTGINTNGNSGSLSYLPIINGPTQSMIVLNAYTIVTGGMRSLLPRLKIIPSTIPKSMDLDMADDTLIVILGNTRLLSGPAPQGAYAIYLGD